MPIALPAPAEPVLGSADVIRGQGSEYASATVQQVQVHVFGPDVVPADRLQTLIGSAENLSDAVRRVQGAYYVAGYPAARVVYALAGQDLYIQVSLAKVTRVDAPEPYAGYLDGMVGADPLTDSALERARTFASLHADRAGQSATPQFVADGDDVALRVEPDNKGPARSSMGLSFGNPGNRFVGRYFLDWFAKTSFTTGDELRATGRHLIEGVEENRTAKGYNEHTVGWNKVTRWGLFGVAGRYVGFQQQVDVVGLTDPLLLDGNIREGELAWNGLLSASFTSRWTVGAKVDYTRKDFTTHVGDLLIQRQEYGSVELSTEYSQALAAASAFPVELVAGVAVRHGLGDDKTDVPVTAADEGYLLFRPSFNARVRLGNAMALRFVAVGQISDDTVPEQQQWVMGGVGNVEAYLPGVAAGDTGGVARLQLEATGYDVVGLRFTPRVFAEYGVARFENPQAFQPSGTVAIADAGVSLGISRGPFEASVSYAESLSEKKIDQSVLDDSDANVFFRVGARF